MKVFYQKVHKRELTLATAEIKPHSSNLLSDVRCFSPSLRMYGGGVERRHGSQRRGREGRE